jgi:uncharacterized membrane protein
MSRLARLWRHLITDRGDVSRVLSAADMARIERAIAAGEALHGGQLCFAIEASLPLPRVWHGLSPRQRALEVFGLLRVWDTERNDGVLLFVLLADRDFEIVADRGIHRHVGEAAWEDICRRMESAFRSGNRMEGIERGIADISALLATHSPRVVGARNELPDKPFVL